MKPDPTKTRSLIRSYERALAGVINNYKKNIIPLLEEYVQQASRYLKQQKKNKKMIYNSIVTDINRLLDSTENQYMKPYIKQIISRYTELAYKKGIEHAALKLKSLRYEISFAMTPADLNAVEMMIDHNLSEISHDIVYMKKEIMRVLSNGMLEGKGIAAMSKEMAERIDVSRSRAITICRTETIRNYNQSAINRYKQNGITQWRWISATDERTCPVCVSLDGEIFDMGEPQPPGFSHPNCRCSVAPYIDEELTPLEPWQG